MVVIEVAQELNLLHLVKRKDAERLANLLYANEDAIMEGVKISFQDIDNITSMFVKNLCGYLFNLSSTLLDYLSENTPFVYLDEDFLDTFMMELKAWSNV